MPPRPRSERRPPAAARVVQRPGESDADPREFFEQAGFRVGPTVGISFAIEAPTRLMKKTFRDYDGQPGELDLERVPRRPRERLQAVVVEEPPDFGPVDG